VTRNPIGSILRHGFSDSAASLMYEARKICNYLLANFARNVHPLTNLRLNKLIFFIHADSLKVKPDGLIRNHFEAWQFGPVIRPVFDSFKVYGDKPITGPALYLDYASGKQIPIPHSDIGPSDAEIIDRSFEEYNRFSTGQLVALSHEPGGPWDVVYKTHLADKTASPRISNELIRRYFAGDLSSRH
jgi:uncharacterized phage-associated protein